MQDGVGKRNYATCVSEPTRIEVIESIVSEGDTSSITWKVCYKSPVGQRQCLRENEVRDLNNGDAKVCARWIVRSPCQRECAVARCHG